MVDLVSGVLSAIEQREKKAQAAVDELTREQAQGGGRVDPGGLEAWWAHTDENRPSEVLRLCQSLRDIVRRHEPITVPEAGPPVVRCRCCGYGGRWPVAWPCDTFTDVARGLGIEDTP